MDIVEIKKAQLLDHKLLTQITFEGKAYWGYSQEQIQKWAEDLTISSRYIEDNEVYNLFLNDEIIGYYSYLKISEKEIKLDNLFLFPKYIGKGYGKLMMSHFLEKATIKKLNRIILEAEPKAQGFYKKFGFVTYDQHEPSIKGRFLPLMSLDLTSNISSISCYNIS